jgi:hypothetical protein
VPLVEPLRVHAVEAMHKERQLLAAALHDEVEVRSHEAPCEHTHSEEIGGCSEDANECRAINVVEKDEDAAGSARRDVVDPIWKLGSWSARHCMPTVLCGPLARP